MTPRTNWPLAFIAGGIILLGVTMPGKTRGLRNNNPGNIKYDGSQWVGLVGKDEKGFCKFDTMNHGLRALGIVILNYQKKYGINTLAKFGDRYAPVYDNPGAVAGGYGREMAKTMGFLPDRDENSPIMFNLYLLEMMKAVCIQENGRIPARLYINEKQLVAGLSMAKASVIV